MAGSVAADDIRFWTTEEQPERLAKQQAMAADFAAASGHNVEVIPVTESDLGTRATAAFAAGDLPDVIYHTLQYALPWAEAGILDTDAASELVDELGTDTFSAGPLSMAAFEDGVASVPVDGWTQMIVYRKDLFDAAGLEAPSSYANVQAAIDKLHNPPEMYAFVAATKVDENFMSQVLKQSRELYFSGNASMIIWSPFILDELAGLRDSAAPSINDDPTTKELAAMTGIVTNFSGPSNPDGAAWGDVRYFGITSDANTDVAQDFIKYSMDEGYAQTLSIAAEGKFPVRTGTADEPGKYTAMWSELEVGVDRKAALKDLYAAEMLDEIVGGLQVAQRWGVAEGQLSLASKMINSQVINRVVRQYIDGEVDAAAAVAALNEELAKIN